MFRAERKGRQCCLALGGEDYTPSLALASRCCDKGPRAAGLGTRVPVDL